MIQMIYPMETYSTKYGKVTLYKNDVYISQPFKDGSYWDIDTLLKLLHYIDPDRNILEIGGHCGTSSLIYASFITKKVFVYEPQKNMYQLLEKNITQNNLQDRIIPYHKGVFCYEGKGTMNNLDLDGGGGVVAKRYTEEIDLQCNFGGIGLGVEGEEIELTTIDKMKLPDIGYIHCDAQGAESYIFSSGLETLARCRPIIYYENKELGDIHLYNNVCKTYPQYETESKFDIKQYCMETLGYSYFIDRFNGGLDTLLIP